MVSYTVAIVVPSTAATAEDTGSELGWTVYDTSLKSTHSGDSWTKDAAHPVMKLAILGSVVSPPTPVELASNLDQGASAAAVISSAELPRAQGFLTGAGGPCSRPCCNGGARSTAASARLQGQATLPKAVKQCPTEAH